MNTSIESSNKNWLLPTSPAELEHHVQSVISAIVGQLNCERAAVYSRVSNIDQHARSYSMEYQPDRAEEYARSKGWQIAGLYASLVTYACLRHTAAAMHLESGADAAALQQFLGRKYLQETRRYIGFLGRMAGKRRLSPRRAPQVPRGPYLRKQRHAQPGNLNAIKHGFFAHSLREEDSQNLHELTIAAMDEEIMALRVLLRRAFSLSDGLDNLPDALRMLNIFGRTAERVGKLLLHKRNLQVADKKSAMHAAIDQAILEIGQELGIGDQKG